MTCNHIAVIARRTNYFHVLLVHKLQCHAQKSVGLKFFLFPCYYAVLLPFIGWLLYGQVSIYCTRRVFFLFSCQIPIDGGRLRTYTCKMQHIFDTM